MRRLRGILRLLMDSPSYFNRPLKLRLEHVKQLSEREEVIELSRTDKDLTESAAADRNLYREATGMVPAVKRYTAKKHDRLKPYSRSQRRANKVRMYDED